ncbi:hypothetical protein [Mesorhizobium sp. 8]|uniref:hypothetical protein n=1 Tax=Mesorhizobium sp. 8 TaxID=2584466 RepID=UPI001123AF59|nr:hypothetical protein [Mesorhizobium sp. 8]QDC01716.1 hypothetical protein FGU64_15500 [Mesorhizobium sp. 8]
MSRQTEIDAARARAIHLLQTRGFEASVRAAINLCEDEDAPAAARASAINSIMRANGAFTPQTGEQTKEMSEMTAAELKALTAQLERDRQQMLRDLEQDEDTAFD